MGGKQTINVFLLVKGIFFLPSPFLHCPSGCYAAVVHVECGCLTNNAHGIYQFILKC